MGIGLLQTVRREIKYALEHPGSELWRVCNKYRNDPSIEQKVIEYCCTQFGSEWGIKYVPECNRDLRRGEFVIQLEFSLQRNHPDDPLINDTFDKWLQKHGTPCSRHDYKNWVKIPGEWYNILDIWDFIDDTNLPYPKD